MMANAIKREWKTSSAEETVRVGEEIAARLQAPAMLILRGGLGAGKTTLVKGIAQAIGAADADEVTSPTFMLLHEYAGERDGKPLPLYHMDVYRLENERQLDTVGWEELLREQALVLVEWGEKFPILAKRADGEISLEGAGDSRTIVLQMNR